MRAEEKTVITQKVNSEWIHELLKDLPYILRLFLKPDAKLTKTLISIIEKADLILQAMRATQQ